MLYRSGLEYFGTRCYTSHQVSLNHGLRLLSDARSVKIDRTAMSEIRTGKIGVEAHQFVMTFLSGSVGRRWDGDYILRGQLIR